jgi:lysozyme
MVDLAYCDPDVDFHELLAGGVQAVFLKASQHDYEDPRWHEYRARAQSVGLLVAPYHYFTHGGDAADQCKRHLEIIAPYAGLLSSALDVEDPAAMGRDDLSRSVRAWIDTYRSITGHRPYIYTYPSFNTSRLAHTFGDCDLWGASYPSAGLAGKPVAFAGWPNGLTFWQWTDRGTVRGVNRAGGTDRDVFFGSIEQLRARVIT